VFFLVFRKVPLLATYNPITDHSLVVKFADDIISAFPLFKNSDNSYIHDEHAGLLNWSNKNNLILHLDKSKSLTISHCNNTDVNSVSLNKVQEVDSVKLLGVIFSSNCSWKKHISNIVSTASRKLHILRVLKKFLPKSELINVYFASIRSSLEYCSPLFGTLPVLLSNDLERIQSRAHRIICGRHCSCNKFTPLVQRRHDHSLSLLQSAILDPRHVLHPIMPTRSFFSNKLLQSSSNTTRRLNSFIPSTTKIFNSTL